jgi:hypothetical protein
VNSNIPDHWNAYQNVRKSISSPGNSNFYMITALEILGNGNHLIWQNPPRSEGEGNCRENNGQHTINSNSAASYRDRCVRDLFRGEDKNKNNTPTLTGSRVVWHGMWAHTVLMGLDTLRLGAHQSTLTCKNVK